MGIISGRRSTTRRKEYRGSTSDVRQRDDLLGEENPARLQKAKRAPLDNYCFCRARLSRVLYCAAAIRKGNGVDVIHYPDANILV